MLIVCGIVGAVVAGMYLYAQKLAQVPRLYAKPGKLKNSLLKHSKTLQQKYCVPFWCCWGSIHTIVRQFLQTHPVLPFEREILKYEDGGQSALDWLAPKDDRKTAPIVIILPGLTGSTSDSYVLHLAWRANKDGCRAVVFNNRGNGGIDLMTPATYSAAYTEDLRVVVAHVHKKYPEAQVMAVGFSLGGMILVNYVSKYDRNECGLVAAMAISSPWNAFESTRSLEKGLYRYIFNRRLARNLRQGVMKNRPLFEKLIDVDSVLRCETIRQFDERFIVPLFNYENVDDYYKDASFYYKVNSVSIPTLCLNAADDCFAPIDAIPLHEVQNSDNVAVVVTSLGGHIAFMDTESTFDGGLSSNLFSEYARIVFEVL